jgi:hypothetical protein
MVETGVLGSNGSVPGERVGPSRCALACNSQNPEINVGVMSTLSAGAWFPARAFTHQTVPVPAAQRKHARMAVLIMQASDSKMTLPWRASILLNQATAKIIVLMETINERYGNAQP